MQQLKLKLAIAPHAQLTVLWLNGQHSVIAVKNVEAEENSELVP